MSNYKDIPADLKHVLKQYMEVRRGYLSTATVCSACDDACYDGWCDCDCYGQCVSDCD